MRDARLVQLFERYRSKGDADALATVFDEVAPALLKVARHIDGRTGEAEDLVQTTFLVAIERAAAFDVSRPLVPWLMGILINQSRLTRRRRSRTDEGVVEEKRSDSDLGLDIENREFATAVVGALRELPEVYQQVLLPHLTQGLKPGEIADLLGRPHGTVRAQIHRGIRMIRRVLPAGFALGWAATMTGPESLASVRDEILKVAREKARDKGSSGSGPPQVTLRTGRSLLQKSALTSLALVLGVAAWMLFREVRAGEPVSIAAAGAGRIPESARARAPERAAEDPRSRTAIEGAPVEIEAEPYGAIRLRVTTAKDHAPAAGRHVSVLAWGEEEWYAHVIEAITDAEGTALLDHVHAGRVGIHVDHGQQMRETVVGGQRLSVDIELPRGLDIAGRVVDRAGHPIAGARLETWERGEEGPRGALDEALVRDDPTRPSEAGDRSQAGRRGGTAPAESARSRACTTRADGSFALSDVDRRQFLFARANGYAVSELYWLGSPQYRASELIQLEIVLSEPGVVITGRVLDPRGAPVAGARVLITRARGASSSSVASSAGIPEALPTNSPESARPSSVDRQLADPHDAPRAGHASSVARSLDADGRVASDGRVLHESRGLPMESMSPPQPDAEETGGPSLEHSTAAAREGLALPAEARPRAFADGSVRIDAAPLWTSTDEQGAFTTEAIAPGPVSVLVECRGFAPWSTRIEAGDEASGDLVAHLTRGAALRGIVRTRDGAAAEGALVSARSPLIRTPLTARTDADGVYVLEHIPAGETVLSARARGFGAPSSATILSREGQSLAWDAVVELEQVIEGSVIGPDDRPVKIWLVKAVPEDRDPRWPGLTFDRWLEGEIFADPAAEILQCWTDERGRFRVPCRGPVPHRLELRPRKGWSGAPHATLPGVQPGRSDVVVRYVPTGSWVRGVLAPPSGAEASACQVIAIHAQEGSAAQIASDATTGEFKLGPLPEGSYEIIAWPAGSAPQSLGRHELSRGTTLDLGMQRLARSE